MNAALNDSVPEQFMGGFYGAGDKSIGGMYHLLGHAEGWVTPDSRTPWAERRSRRLKDNSAANLQLNELSRTFHREQTSFLGLDGGLYGQGAWGAVESVAITGLTAPLVPAFTVANHARLTLALNAAAKVAPSAAIFGTRKGISTYDEAIAAGKTESEALRLAWTSGVMEGAITAAFNAAGAGGIEGIASGSARELFRHTMRQSVTNTWLAGAKEFARGTLGEVGEEVLIEALDTAFVRMSLRPDMTVGEFFKSLHDTALVTAFTSAPSSAVHGANSVRDVRGMDGGTGKPPAANPFRTTDGRLPIKLQSDPTVDPDLAAKEAEFIEILNRPIKEVDAAYDAIHDELESSYGGKVISTDLPRKLLKPFAESKEGRERYTAITTGGARAYGRDRLWREIHNRGERRKLMFTAGGIAAGKSSVVTGEVMEAQDLVYDATLRETGWAIRNIEKALENGWEVQIVYVQRPIELAMQGAVDRAGQQGRSFPLADLPAAHRDAQRSIIEIAKRFEGNEKVKVDLWMNAGASKAIRATEMALSQIDKGGQYSYEHISHVTDARRTESLARSYEESDSERIRTASRGAVLDAFQRAVGRKDLSREVLSGLAGKDPELQRILKESGR